MLNPAGNQAPRHAGFAFIYIKDKRDGDDAIRYLDGCAAASLCG